MRLSVVQAREIAGKLQGELEMHLAQDGRVRHAMRDTRVPEGGDESDQAVVDHIRELAVALGNGTGVKIVNILAAQLKLEDGGFGACERCGEDIALARIKAIPTARHCIECQRAVETEERLARAEH